MVYFYTLVLMVSAGVFGTFCRSVMLGVGFVPDLGSGLYLLLASGAGYLFMQCVYMGVLRLLQPTTASSTYFSEMASNSATLLFLPYILHVSVPWPSDTLIKVEPLLYLGGFGVVHLFLKLSTFYASLQGAPSNRKGVLGYLSVSIICLVLVWYFQVRWMTSLEDARTQVSDQVDTVVTGTLHAEARLMQEGASLHLEAVSMPGQTITTRWSSSSDDDVNRVYATFVMQGDTEAVYQSSTSLKPMSWSEIRVPNENIPEGLRSYEVRWTRQAEPNWQRILGLRPIVYNLPETPGGEAPPLSVVQMSGPFMHGERPLVRNPNIVVIMVDGLAANHVSMLGYGREVTPSLDKLGYGGLSFPNVYSPSANVVDVARTLFYGEGGSGSIVSALGESGYSTIGFSEGNASGRPDLTFTSGIQTGFELFDAHYDTEAGSGGTVQKAQQWINDHQSVKFFMLVRLRSLEDLSSLKDIEGAYPANGSAHPIDVFDNGLQRLDSQIGSLLKYIRDRNTRKNTFVIVMSPYGHAFSIRSDGRKLEQPTLRTPLIVNGPGIRKTKVSTRVELDDITATIATLGGVRFSGSGEGQSVL